MMNPAACLYKFKNMNLPAVISAARIAFMPRSIGFRQFVLKHYNVISIVATNVVGCIAFQGIAQKTTLMDNTIAKMQFRCFLVSASHSHASKTFICDTKIQFLCNLEAEIWTF